MMWFFNWSKIANGCNISFNCHFIISYGARFWNHHERRLLKVHRSMTFSIYLLLIQTLFETNSSFTLYKVLFVHIWVVGWSMFRSKNNIKQGMEGGLHWDLRLTRATTAWASWSSNDFTWWSQESSDNEDKSDTASSEVYKNKLISIASGLYEQYDCHVNVFPCWQDKIRDMALKIKS